MVRKDGYFSITDACIKLCRASFLIVRPNKIKKKIKKNSFRFSLRDGEGTGKGCGEWLLLQQHLGQVLPMGRHGWGTSMGPGSE